MTTASPAASRPVSPEYAAPWDVRAYVTDLDGPVHWIEFVPQTPKNARVPETGDQDQGQQPPPIVFVHGLGGSHLNWCLLGPHLAAGRRAVALDLRGFGLTPGLRANSTVRANARLLDRFIREVIGTPVILVANSMGGLISILETSSNPDLIKGVVLIDPALPLPPQKPDWQVSGQFLLYAIPGLGEFAVAKLMASVSPEKAVQQLVQLCFADPSRADPEMIRAEVALSTKRHPATPAQAKARARIFLAAARSLLRVLNRRQRYAKMMAGIDVPVLLIGGEDDRLVPVAAMRQAAARNPRWESVILPGVGHTPMLEVPDDTSAAIRDWLDRHFKS
ncbi:MAG TPA: alpha/beta hydrolase [Streptosporangiaceae bacterium]|nr:alpha/beta hydrolase [Streptosporangiaceae bacterium]